MRSVSSHLSHGLLYAYCDMDKLSNKDEMSLYAYIHSVSIHIHLTIWMTIDHFIFVVYETLHSCGREREREQAMEGENKCRMWTTTVTTTTRCTQRFNIFSLFRLCNFILKSRPVMWTTLLTHTHLHWFSYSLHFVTLISESHAY